MRSYILDNVKAVLPAETAECSVRIEDGYIREIGTDLSAAGAGRFDGEGAWLVPGFTDIHCDSLERAIAPRPGFAFPLDVAIPAYSRELATHGITSVFHCVAIADTGENRKFLRDRETAVRIIDSINCLKSGLSIKTNIHLRYEILDTESLPLVRELVMGGAVQMISFMDHTPGYGVFKDFEAYRHYAVRSGKSEQESREMFTSMNAMRENVDLDAVYDLMHEAVEHGVVVATHDDHTEEKVERAHSNGVSISDNCVWCGESHKGRFPCRERKCRGYG